MEELFGRGIGTMYIVDREGNETEIGGLQEVTINDQSEVGEEIQSKFESLSFECDMELAKVDSEMLMDLFGYDTKITRPEPILTVQMIRDTIARLSESSFYPEHVPCYLHPFYTPFMDFSSMWGTTNNKRKFRHVNYSRAYRRYRYV